MEYPIPPWLHGVSPGEIGQLYQNAQRAGAQIQMEQQRLSQESQQAQMALQAKQEAAKQDQMRQAQQMQIEKAYHDSEIGLRKSQLEQTQKELQQKTQIAAQTFQAKQQAQQRIAAGEDPQKVWMELGPMMGVTGAGLANLAKKPVQFGGATSVEGLPEDWKAVQTGAGSRRIIHIPTTETGTNTAPTTVTGPNGEMLGYRIPMPGGKQIFRGPPKSNSFEEKLKAVRAARGNPSDKNNLPPKVDAAELKAQKVKFANDLAKQHPDWSRDKIIEETHKAFAK